MTERQREVGDKESCFAEDEKAQADDRTTSSFLHAVINMVGMLIGLGQLSTPYALENGGWASTFLLVGLGSVCAYTSCLLGKCMHKNPKSRDYKDIGYDAFGSKGRIIATTFIYLEIFMALVSYTISLHDNLANVFTTFTLSSSHLSSSQLLALIAVLVALPSLWLRDLSYISFLSSAGILLSLLIFTSVAYTAVSGAIRAHRYIPVLHISKIPAISGLYMFSFAGHIVFPNLYNSMNDPSKFTKVSIVSFSMVTVLYTALGFMGAKMFGPQVSSQITLSMPRNLVVTKIALWATVLTPMTKYALEFAPFAMQLEQSLPPSFKSRTRMIIRGTVGSILLLIILVLALTVPYFEHVLSLTGSLVSVGICIIFPCAFYTRIFWRQISTRLLLLNLVLITFGATLGAFGTFSSSRSLIISLQRGHTS
ncbi:amino acid transporter AVT1H [Salvia hispanica]|uniref:amino acid transporter AVT1H n=1 Tax=Salvia hispanica TaxID=49212 RepID=UPI002009009B|nr:amino acid transporter AVT1H [Salvia hispanica]